MPRYFFHLTSGNVTVEDKDGREFSCAEDAFFHARRVVIKAQPYLDADDGQWIIRVEAQGQDCELIVLFPRRIAAVKAKAWWRKRN